MLAIEIRDLHKRYRSHEVLRGLSMTVEKGQIYGLLGPNGSGKTTTLSCALGLQRPNSGSATILGEPADRLFRLGGRLSAVFDTAVALPGMTAMQNLSYVRKLLGHGRGRGPGEVLALVGLESRSRTRVRALSLGQQKRLAIAGALLGDPELLVLDEPLSGLDTLGVRSILSLFRSLQSEGVTLVLSSHRLHEMETVISHAGILLEGCIVREGSLAELLGEGQGVHYIEVDDRLRALHCVEAQEGAEGLTAAVPAAGPGRIEVRVSPGVMGPLNRSLVQAGVLVSCIEPRGESLLSVFEGLVDRHRKAPVSTTAERTA